MANTLTDLIPDIYAAMNIVSRELVGFIPAVTRDASVDRVAVGTNVIVPLAPAAAAEDITPGTTPPDTGDQVFETETIAITKARAVPFRSTGEEQAAVNQGPGWSSLQVQQIAQALRTLINEIETDLGALYTQASAAYGTSGQTPFGTAAVLTDLAELRKILDENGAPATDLQFVMDSSAMAKLRGVQSTLFKVNEAGTDELLREGLISQGLQGFQIRNSAKVAFHTKGTADAAYDVDLVANYVVGDTDIHIDTGIGTHKAGDIFTFAGDTRKYVIKSDELTASQDKDIVINKPGLMESLADGVSLSAVQNDYTANLGFSRSAIILAARQPYRPKEGDMAFDVTSITDPVTGMTFEFSMYKQYRRIRYEVALAWGVKCIKSAHLAILQG